MEQKWYENKILVILSIFIFFPIGLFFLWKSSNFNKKGKIIGTAVTLLFVIIVSNMQPQQNNPQHIDDQKTKMAVPDSSSQQGYKSSKTIITNQINVTLDEVSHVFENGKLYVLGKTNLPDTTKLIIKINRGNNYYASSMCQVTDGMFKSIGFSYKNFPQL